ncbi:Serine/threonine-protein kinase crk1 [Pseudocercospora fuligena]|uniref:Serine/threonine-protein kinase crk1 n=1 Tax=Pseudocercospora fuligena TaxID=685502 RepID=A0A8H6RQE2_9PEZI|nr:Serine/threonine-protein kinase crk1 [Pseudocercospora fuligena]
MAAPRSLKSPALDVPPEPPFKRVKLSPRPDSQTNTSTPNSPSGSAPTADLAEQLDAAERNKYVKGKKLGSGQYADVFSAHLKTDPSQLVAIKKIKVGAEAKEFGISYDSLREIKFLQELNHPNIIKLISVYSTKGQNLNLVLEQLPQGDLLKLIQDTQNISYTASDIKAWMLMLMRAIWFCHKNFVLHRDIKPNNLLIAANGEIKLADFGLARSFADPYQPMTYNTITIWYRPPELFFQAKYYGEKVDIWSCGCVFAELIARDVLFRAWPESEINMIKLICEKVGTPTDQNWPGVEKLPGYVIPDEKYPLRSRDYWAGTFRAIGDEGIDLLIKMLTLDPRKRFSAEQTLKHDFWTSAPRPSKLEDLPRKGGGIEAMGEDLKRRGGELPGTTEDRGDKVARKIDFGAKR